jgi:molybdenum cofactor cytidylyltransferase
MGRPKLLLPWGETTVCGHLLAQWRELGAEQICAVCAEGDHGINAELDRLGWLQKNRIYNPVPEHGMFSSVQCAARWKGWRPALTHWAIILGDQPHLLAVTLRRLLSFAAAHPQQICLPWQAGHRRHPVLLPKPAFAELAQSTVASLKEFLDLHKGMVALCELEDPDLELDIDTPKDYEKALTLRGLAARNG